MQPLYNFYEMLDPYETMVLSFCLVLLCLVLIPGKK